MVLFSLCSQPGRGSVHKGTAHGRGLDYPQLLPRLRISRYLRPRFWHGQGFADRERAHPFFHTIADGAQRAVAEYVQSVHEPTRALDVAIKVRSIRNWRRFGVNRQPQAEQPNGQSHSCPHSSIGELSLYYPSLLVSLCRWLQRSTTIKAGACG